jgi:putative phosphoribosyl transferase
VPLHFAERFKDRYDAARKLAFALKKYANKKSLVVLAIPNGGLPVGAFLAKTLHLPLDVALAKKLPAPGTEELAIGALTAEGGLILDKKAVEDFAVSEDYIEAEKTRLQGVLHKKDTFFHQNVSALPLAGKTVLLVDDGMATGQTMRAVIKMLRHKKVARVIVATPVSSEQAAKSVRAQADAFYSLVTDKIFYAVGTYYTLFPHIEDEEALRLLQESRATQKRSRTIRKSKKK